MSSQDIHRNTVGCIFLPKPKLNNLKTLYLHRVARKCIFAVQVQVGTALIVFMRSLRPKAHVFATSYLFSVLQNCETQHRSLKVLNIPDPKTVLGLKRWRIFKIVKKRCMHFSKHNDCLFDISYLTLAFEVAKNGDVDVVKIKIFAYAKYLSNEMARFFILTNRMLTQIGTKLA